MNKAQGKSILETKNWNNSQTLTDGNVTNYDAHNGFGHAPFPAYCTLDLGEVCAIQIIRFLLWDRDGREYKYRLLVSDNLDVWTVCFDSENHWQKGWQNFIIKSPSVVRYIRIHCLLNSLHAVNKGFHIVQIEAHDQEVKISPQEFRYTVREPIKSIENRDGLAISTKMTPIVSDLRRLGKDVPGLDEKHFSNLADELESRIYDVQSIEKVLESVRLLIIEPVNKELSRGNRIGNISIFLGILGGLIGFVSILNSIFKWFGT